MSQYMSTYTISHTDFWTLTPICNQLTSTPSTTEWGQPTVPQSKSGFWPFCLIQTLGFVHTFIAWWAPMAKPCPLLQTICFRQGPISPLVTDPISDQTRDVAEPIQRPNYATCSLTSLACIVLRARRECVAIGNVPTDFSW